MCLGVSMISRCMRISFVLPCFRIRQTAYTLAADFFALQLREFSQSNRSASTIVESPCVNGIRFDNTGSVEGVLTINIFENVSRY